MYPLPIKIQWYSWRPLLLASAFGLCLWLGLLGASSALADDPVLVPDAPGSISGVVTDENGAPLPGITVILYQNSQGSWDVLRLLTTDINGLYKAAILRTGIYHIGFRDPQQRYATVYYGQAVTVEDGTDIAVAGNDVTGMNAQLTIGGRISGTVLLTGTLKTYDCSAGCIPVTVMHKTGTQWRAVATVGLSSTGTYSFTELMAGVYRLCTNFYRSPYYFYNPLQECYDNVASGIENAQDITVTAGQIINDVNFALGDGADLATIGGRVTSATGVPLAGVTVRVIRWPGSETSVIGEAQTDALGFYQVPGLPVGDYVVGAKDMQGPHIGQYYNNTDRYEFADRIHVGANEQRFDVNLNLALGGQITGTIFVGDQLPATKGSIEIIRDGDDTVQGHIFTGVDSRTSTYNSGGLRPGIYRVIANVALDTQTYLSGYYGGISYAQAMTVAVGTGEIQRDIDVTVGLATSFDGIIAGQVTGDRTPQAGIQVTLYPDEYFYNPNPYAFFHTFTDALGHYEIGGLADGAYLINFSDPAGTYAITKNYQFSIVNSHTISNVNLALQHGGAISGHVTRRDGEPVSNVQVDIQYSAAEFEPTIFIPPQITDATGAYTAKGLPPGGYRVCFTDSTLFSSNERVCYSPFGTSPWPDYLANVAVTAGVETKGIDMVFGSAGPGRLYLPQIAR